MDFCQILAGAKGFFLNPDQSGREGNTLKPSGIECHLGNCRQRVGKIDGRQLGAVFKGSIVDFPHLIAHLDVTQVCAVLKNQRPDGLDLDGDNDTVHTRIGESTGADFGNRIGDVHRRELIAVAESVLGNGCDPEADTVKRNGVGDNHFATITVVLFVPAGNGNSGLGQLVIIDAINLVVTIIFFGSRADAMQHHVIITGPVTAPVHGIQLKVSVKSAVPSPVDVILAAVEAVEHKTVSCGHALARIDHWPACRQVLLKHGVPLLVAIITARQICRSLVVAECLQTHELVRLIGPTAGNRIIHLAGLSAITHEQRDRFALFLGIMPRAVFVKH